MIAFILFWVFFIMDERVKYFHHLARCSFFFFLCPEHFNGCDCGKNTIWCLFPLLSLHNLYFLFQPEYKVADPICTFLFSVFVLCTTITILRDVFRILMEGISLGNQWTVFSSYFKNVWIQNGGNAGVIQVILMAKRSWHRINSLKGVIKMLMGQGNEVVFEE